MIETTNNKTTSPQGQTHMSARVAHATVKELRFQPTKRNVLFDTFYFIQNFIRGALVPSLIMVSALGDQECISLDTIDDSVFDGDAS